MTKRLLIVDDDSFIRDVAQVTLRKTAGWATITAASGREALETVKQEQANGEALDAILLDISMPGMDGFSVFEQLQADPATQPIPVILLTAKALPDDLQQFTEMGFAGVIVKPFDPLTICRQIAEILGW
jgi:CheY-like chemotaxis protein